MRIRWTIFVTVFLPILYLNSLSAQEIATHPTYILVVDESRSLRSTDPQNVRIDALSLVAELMLPRDEVWILGFGEYARELTAGPQILLERSERRHISRKEVNRIVSTLGDGESWTNYAAPLELVLETVRSWPAERILVNPPVLFFFTDGKLDVPAAHVPPNHSDPIHVINLISSLNDLGVSIYTVGLGDFDRSLLDKMGSAAQRAPLFIPDATDLITAFWSIMAKNQNLCVLGRSGRLKADQDVVVPATVKGKAARLYALLSGPNSGQSPTIWTEDAQGYRCGGSNEPDRCASGLSYRLAELLAPPIGIVQGSVSGLRGQELVLLQQGGISWRATCSQAELFPGIYAEVNVFAEADGDTVRPADAAFLRDPSLRVNLEGKQFTDDDTVRGAIAQDGVILARVLVKEEGPSPLSVEISSIVDDETVFVEGPRIVRTNPISIIADDVDIEAFWPQEHKVKLFLQNNLERTVLGARLHIDPPKAAVSSDFTLLNPGEVFQVEINLPRSFEPSTIGVQVVVEYNGTPTAQVIAQQVQYRTVSWHSWALSHKIITGLLLVCILTLLWIIYMIIRPRPKLKGRFLEIWDKQGHRQLREELSSEHGRIVYVALIDSELRLRVKEKGDVICSLRMARRDKRCYEVLTKGRLTGKARLGDDIILVDSWRVQLN